MVEIQQDVSRTMQEPALKLLSSDDEVPSAKLADKWRVGEGR